MLQPKLSRIGMDSLAFLGLFLWSVFRRSVVLWIEKLPCRQNRWEEQRSKLDKQLATGASSFRSPVTHDQWRRVRLRIGLSDAAYRHLIHAHFRDHFGRQRSAQFLG